MQKGFGLLPTIFLIGGIIILGIAGVVGYNWAYTNNYKNIRNIHSFNACKKAGYPVLMSYPAQCKTPDGQLFVQPLSGEEKKKLQVSSAGGESSFLTYRNAQYHYQVDYAALVKYEEVYTKNYGYTSFLNGCFTVYASPISFRDTRVRDRTGVPWGRFDELDLIKDGESKTYAMDEITLADGKKQEVKSTYKKVPSNNIADLDWLSFEVTNNWENHTLNNLHYISRNDYLYVINIKSQGPCYENEPLKMLETFKFTD